MLRDVILVTVKGSEECSAIPDRSTVLNVLALVAMQPDCETDQPAPDPEPCLFRPVMIIHDYVASLPVSSDCS